MPFRLRFKKTRRYDISSKNDYRVEVQMLDSSLLACTLTPDSTGHECLDGIAQKIELQELHYFGLRYVTKKLQFRWVELDKPLKKQLEKYAQPSTSHANKSPRLYFGVIFYIANAHKILDDVARYQYYLQLKTDIVDGRLPLTVDQVIRLAAYSLQVDFDNYNTERNPADYFADNPVFPKNLTRDQQIVQELMGEVLQVYGQLQGIAPVRAEILYMKDIQMLDGYGMEYYVAKDERGKELYLGTSYSGIFARYLDNQPPVFFKWADVNKLQQSKKNFEIGSANRCLHYQMEDSDTAKYLKRMCLLQQKFYKSAMATPSATLEEYMDNAESLSDLQQSTLSHSNERSVDVLAESQSSLQYTEQTDSRSENTDEYYNQSQTSLNVSSPDLTSLSGQPYRRASSASMAKYQQQLQQQQQHYEQQHQSQHPHYAPSAEAFTADPSLAPHYSSRLAALPAYRPAPSYARVMEQKMAQMNQAHLQHVHLSNQALHVQPDINQNITNTNIYAQKEVLAYSQPNISAHTAYSQPNITDQPMNFTSAEGYRQIQGSPARNYPSHSVSMYPDMYQGHGGYDMNYRYDRQTNLSVQPTYSSPELTTQGLPQDYAGDAMFNMDQAYLYHYKPPPPYPRASNSTPDLAAQTGSHGSMNSPDLISRKHLVHSAFSSSTNIQEIVENLTDSIPEVVNVNDPANDNSNLPAQIETDDASSDHSNSTFHVKETDSETEETFVRSIPQRQSSQSKVTVRRIPPNKAAPQSMIKEVATKRESFRRMMIARSGSFTPGVLNENSKRIMHNNRSLRSKTKNSIEEHILETSRGSQSGEVVKDPVRENVKNVLNKVAQNAESNVDSAAVKSQSKEIMRSQSDTNKAQNKVKVVHEKSVSVDSSQERQQLLNKLKHNESDVETIREQDQSMGSRERLVDYDDSDSDSEVPQSPIGPLKLAAMNGLTMSRPMVLALMNDETRAPKDERRRVLEKKLSENTIFKEFEETPKKISDFECSVAKLPENSLRNRFRDVVPYDCTRVKLNPRKDNSSGYINASHIKLTVGQKLWWYIATQAPMDCTPVDFWQMVWEQEVEVIAMLTALMELGRPKCYPYWPQDPGPDDKLVFGDYQVQLMFSNDSVCYVTNLITLRHIPSKKERHVWHLQYTDWPDHGCPDDMYGFLGFLDEIESVQRLAEEGSGKKSPLVIHCSAGVGRTGVVILTQIMKWCLDSNQEIDIPKALSLIRQQRMYMVQTLGQYDFVHKTLIQYLKNTRLI
ncbi:tyrosine-protein phosphatase non-receptor type 21-like [Dreissena polymorpha]|nr:tyrosine-protein phosphatase non-receptor type 21-like [Dreissena polymorpha]XP_052276055.1 tyrosine-protein phosphatase non-receptor type 21-like [Dreissena polymorpha]